MRGKIVLATAGSLGDVHPFIALALRLREIGFDTVLATAESYRAKIEAEGLHFHRVRPDFGDVERELGMNLSQIVQRMRTDPQTIMRDVVVPYIGQTYADVLEALDGATIAITNHMALGARLAVERLALPNVSVVLQPENFFSAYDPPKIPPIPFVHDPSPALGIAWNRVLIRLLKLIGTATYAGSIRELRREIGLPAERRSMVFDADRSAAATLGLYSPLLGKVERDFPARSAVVGFSFYDNAEGGASSPDPDLAAFLATGPPPLVFSLGTLVVYDPGDFYRESLDAARRLGMRAILLTTAAERDRLAGELSTEVIACAYVPHSQVFPYSAAVIHHGGMGTTGQALRAGKPQLVVPFLFDQPDNAHRLARLGVGRVVARKHYTGMRAAEELRTLLDDSDVTECAARAGASVVKEDGAGAAARLIAEIVVP